MISYAENENNNSLIVWIVVIAVAAIVVIAAIFLIVKILKKKKQKHADELVETTIKESTDKLADKFGGKANIEKIQKSLSRVTVIVKDTSLVDKNGIKEIFSSSMFMGNKIVFVIGSDSEKFKTLLEENVDKIEK